MPPFSKPSEVRAYELAWDDLETQAPAGPTLAFTPARWTTFTTAGRSHTLAR